MLALWHISSDPTPHHVHGAPAPRSKQQRFGIGKGCQPSQVAWLGIAAFILIPIIMVVLTLTLRYPAIRWASIVVAVILFVFNLVGLPTYPSAYDKFLIVVGLVLNVLSVWYAWKWA